MEHSNAERRKRRRFKFIAIYILFIILIALTGLIAVNNSMRPALATLAKARITAIAVDSMNRAIMDCMDSGEGYTSLISAKDNGHKVYMLQADTRKMNMLAADCCAEAQRRIAAIGEQGVSVPLGTVSGITYLSGKGPGIRVTFTPAGSVESEFCSSIASSGINQSLYRVNIRLTADIRLIMPGISESIMVTSEAAIAESIIVGDVPQVYTNVAEEDMGNFIQNEPVD